jgi:hypothetical protein
MIYFDLDKTEWDVTRLADRVKNTRPNVDGITDTSVEDARLAKYFKNPQFGDLDMPAVILDCHGRIMLWYLPRILSPYRVVRMFIFVLVWEIFNTPAGWS